MVLLDIAFNFSVVFYLSNIFLIIFTNPSLTNYRDIFHKTYFLSDHYEDDFSDDEEIISKKEIDYSEKYKEEFEQLVNEFIVTELDILDNQNKEEQINQKKQKLKNNIIMEATPLGNVVMYYDYKTEAFNYYSDHSIPYKYLETIARKYVITYKCKPIFIIMEDELKKYEEKMKQHEEIKKEETVKVNNVFAKFKSYNKDNNINSAKNTKDISNNIPQKNNKTNNSDKPLLLKENANRFTHQGKLHNFSFLNKPKKEDINKKQKLSFAEYKKLMQK